MLHIEESFGFLASLLLGLGVDKGRCVLTIVTNVLLYLLLFLFFSKIGVIPRLIAAMYIHALHR